MGKLLSNGAERAYYGRSFDTRRLTTLALLVAVSLVASYIESLLPPLIPIAPGAKLGLGNIAPLIALIVLGVGDAFTVSALKCLLGAFITGGVSGLMYSVPASLISLAVEVVLFKLALGKMSVTTISLIGAVIFNVVQLFVACLVTGVNLWALLPILSVAGVLAGTFTGLFAYTLVKKLQMSVFGRR